LFISLGQGLRGLITKIDRDADWNEFVRLCVDRGKRVQRIDYTQQEFTVSYYTYFLYK
jgi:hypothetical protein